METIKEKISKNNYERLFNLKYNNFYDYSKFIYINKKTKGIIICPIHGEFLMTPSGHYYSKYGCPKCANVKKKESFKKFLLSENYINPNKLNTETFKIKATIVHGHNTYGYWLVDYINSTTKVLIYCYECKEYFWQRPDSHLSGRGCKKCSSKKSNGFWKRLTLEDYIKECNIIHNNFYDYSKSMYINERSLIEVICPIHGSFWINARNHKKGSGCPHCKKSLNSKGEQKLLEFFKDEKDIIPQWKHKDCKNINPLPFDLYVPKYNLLIEYQGWQHYNIGSWGSTEEDLKERQRLDKLKKDWAINNGYNFLEIRYDENVEEKLKECLKSLGSTIEF